MEENFIKQISNIKRKNDNTFIVDYNSLPYHIIPEMESEYTAVYEYVKNNPDVCTDYIEPVYEPSQKEKEDMVRMKRNSLINDADILLLKYQEQVTLSIVQENKDYYTALLQYKQALRDIPEQTDFPDDIEYPELPKYEDYE